MENTNIESSIDWIRSLSPAIRGFARDVANGDRDLSHSALADVANNEHTKYLRSLFVASGVLEDVTLDLSGLESWTRTAIVPTLSAADAAILQQYLRFDVFRRARLKHRRGDRLSRLLQGFRCAVKLAALFLQFVREQGTTLERCDGTVVDRFRVAHSQMTNALIPFLRWAAESQHIKRDLSFHAQASSTKIRALPDAEMQSTLHRIEEPIHPAYLRFAAALLAVYAQMMTSIVALRVSHVHALPDGAFRVECGASAEGLLIIEPYASALRALLASLQADPTKTTDQWLFPSTRFKDRHFGVSALRAALRRSGLITESLLRVRYSALLRLAVTTPAPLLILTFSIGSAAASKASKRVANPSNSKYIAIRYEDMMRSQSKGRKRFRPRIS